MALLSVNYYNIFNVQDETTEKRDKSNLKCLKKAGYWNLPFIHIDGNWSYTVGNYTWCSGTWDNPYTIENVTIDASGSPLIYRNGIFIENSKYDFFIIRNCTVYHYLPNMGNGIMMKNTNNGTLTNNQSSHFHEYIIARK